VITIFYENYVDNTQSHNIAHEIETSVLYVKGILIFIPEMKNNSCYDIKLYTGTVSKFEY